MISGGQVPQIQNDAIYSLPRLYISGLQIYSAAPTGATSIVVSPGAARDMNNVLDMVVGLQNYAGIDLPAAQYLGYQPGLLVSSLVNGANGLDAGSIAASTQYAIITQRQPS